MIELVSLSGLAAFVVASLVVGARILMLAARTRLLPETTVGSSLFLAGGVGTAMMIAPLLYPRFEAGTVYFLYQAGSMFSHIGFLLLFIFVWRVFRPDEAWATALFLACAAALLIGGAGIGMAVEPGGASPAREAEVGGVWFWLSIAGRFAGYTWAAIESFRYHALLKRRLKLGLADEGVVARFFYWGICTSAVVVIWIATAAQNLLLESEGLVAIAGLVTPMMGFVVAGSLWVAFFPKRRHDSVGDSDSVPTATGGQD